VPTLTHDELTTVRKNLQRNGLEIDNEFIRETWHPVYRRFFLQQSLARAYDCRKGYFLYHTGHENEVCKNDKRCQTYVVFTVRFNSNTFRWSVMM
jgi:optic atrophy protein 1